MGKGMIALSTDRLMPKPSVYTNTKRPRYTGYRGRFVLGLCLYWVYRSAERFLCSGIAQRELIYVGADAQFLLPGIYLAYQPRPVFTVQPASSISRSLMPSSSATVSRSPIFHLSMLCVSAATSATGSLPAECTSTHSVNLGDK